jgi:hypothetical protein
MSGKGLSINTVENINLLTNTLNIDSTITNINSISTNINSNIYFNSDMIFTNNNILNSLKNIPDLSEGDTLIYGPSDKFITIQNFSYVYICPTVIDPPNINDQVVTIDGKYNVYNIESGYIEADYFIINLPSINMADFRFYDIKFYYVNKNFDNISLNRFTLIKYSASDSINPNQSLIEFENGAMSLHIRTFAPNIWTVIEQIIVL